MANIFPFFPGVGKRNGISPELHCAQAPFPLLNYSLVGAVAGKNLESVALKVLQPSCSLHRRGEKLVGIERVKLQPSDAPSSSNLTPGRGKPVSDDGPGRGGGLGDSSPRQVPVRQHMGPGPLTCLETLSTMLFISPSFSFSFLN